MKGSWPPTCLQKGGKEFSEVHRYRYDQKIYRVRARRLKRGCVWGGGGGGGWFKFDHAVADKFRGSSKGATSGRKYLGEDAGVEKGTLSGRTESEKPRRNRKVATEGHIRKRSKKCRSVKDSTVKRLASSEASGGEKGGVVARTGRVDGERKPPSRSKAHRL